MCENDRATVIENNLSLMKAPPNSTLITQNESPPVTSYSFPLTANCALPNSGNINPAVLAAYQQRLQLYDYAIQAAVRFRLAHPAFVTNPENGGPYPLPAAYNHASATESVSSFPPLSSLARYDPRFRFIHEEPKPQHSYIGLIAMAILSSPEKKMVLSDIYQHILDNYPYFRNRGPGWRNSIPHNLSLNDCFIKAGRSANGKGHYWAIHPANIEDFKKGDFRRRKAQRKVRKHMGLSVPDDDDSRSPTPTPTNVPNPHVVSHSIPISQCSQVLMNANAHSLLIPPPICSGLALLNEPRLAQSKMFEQSGKCIQLNMVGTELMTGNMSPGNIQGNKSSKRHLTWKAC